MLPRAREALTQLLARTFPHSPDIDAQTVDAFVDGLLRVRAQPPGAAPSPTSVPESDEPGDGSLFVLRATHARRTPITSVFTALSHAVRVELPREQPTTLVTPLGEVRGEDHLLPTVRAVDERFGDRFERPPARVELITPARGPVVRFAPMSLYLGYADEADLRPSWVIYEPGDALGRPGALYFAATPTAVVEERAGYKPTPLSSPDHWYTGGLRMAANGRDPEVLYMRAAVERGGEPHFRLHVEYRLDRVSPLAGSAQLNAPEAGTAGGSALGDLIEAALRMLAVQHGVGVEQSVVERLIAELGLAALPWVDRPDNGEPEERAPSERRFAPNREFEPFLATLGPAERAAFEASVAALVGAVVRADGRLDRLERIELDWLMNFEVPRALGDAFRFSPAAARTYEAVLDDTAELDGPAFDARLAEIAEIVERLPPPLAEQYRAFVREACGKAAEASGGWLWFGTKVGEAERRVLEQIEAALRLR